MSVTEKTNDQIREESNRNYKEFLEELKRIREYQSKNDIIKRSPGGLTLDLGHKRDEVDKKNKLNFNE